MNFKKINIKALIMTIVVLSGIEQNANAQSYKKTDAGLSFSTADMNVEVKFYGSHTMRIIKYLTVKSFVKK